MCRVQYNEKVFLRLMALIIITFIIGISTFMAGCATDLPGTCIMYHEIKGISVGYNVKKRTCYMDGTLRYPYDCYDGNILIDKTMTATIIQNATIQNVTCELNELYKWTDENKVEEHMKKIPLLKI